MRKITWIQRPDGYLNKTPLIQFALITALFPLWGVAVSMNDILITQFKGVFTLSDFATALVQFVFFGAYFVVAIPASMIIKKTSYKTSALIGLLFYIIGCLLFYPASSSGTYNLFLVALFIMAIGLGILETTAGTFSVMLGHPDRATVRLNTSQAFNPIGNVVGILLGKYLVFKEGASLINQMSGMSGDELHNFKLATLQHTLQPYKFMIFVLVAVFILILITKFPLCKVEQKADNSGNPSTLEGIKYLIGNKRFKKGWIAQFLQLGLQIAVWSFTIRLALVMDPNLNERSATNYMLYSFIVYLIGRAISTVLLTRIPAMKLLFIYSCMGTLLLLYISFVPSFTVVYACILLNLFFAPGFPTLYATNVESVERKYTETAGGAVTMTIVGGALIPPIQGLISDKLGSMQHSFIVPMIALIYVGIFVYSQLKSKISEEATENIEVI